MKTNKPKQVLLVDDDPDYTYLIEEAFKGCQPCPDIKVLHSGTDLLNWLKISSRPSLIFLDINMPGTNGFEVLEKLKKEDKYRTIPVVMLTMSGNRNDVIKSYQIGANAYMIKPITFTQLVTRMQVFSQYWFDLAKTPDSSWSKPNNSTDN